MSNQRGSRMESDIPIFLHSVHTGKQEIHVAERRSLVSWNREEFARVVIDT